MGDAPEHWKGYTRLPPMPTEVFADPGRRGWYFRERMPDSVARFVRDDAILSDPRVMALVRQAMAAYVHAYEEPDRDIETPEEADRITGRWFAKWMIENHPTRSSAEAHSGDCTNHSWSCLRCHADEAFASADVSLSAWVDALAALQVKP